jgi:hypothetical protein
MELLANARVRPPRQPKPSSAQRLRKLPRRPLRGKGSVPCSSTHRVLARLKDGQVAPVETSTPSLKEEPRADVQRYDRLRETGP